MSSALSPSARRLVTTLGLGFMQPASGTWGSMPPVALAGAMMVVGLGPAHGGPAEVVYTLALLAVLVVFTLACAVHGDAAEARFGHDPGEVVADETAGQCLPLLFLPGAAVTGVWHAAFTLLLAFVAFRLFDIFKPWPARQLQRWPGGWGIVLDDLAAGLQAAIVVQVLTRVLM